MRKQKFAALTACLVAVAILATACTGGSTSSTPASSSVASEPASSAASTEAPESSQAAEPSEDGGLSEINLPLSEEKINLTFWKSWSNDYTPDLNDYAVVKKMEELTNVHVEYITVGAANAKEKYGMMLASGDIADMVFGNNGCTYPGGGEKAIADKVYLDMTDFVEQYMPNYREMRVLDETIRKMTVTDTGKIWAVYMLRSTDDLEIIPEPCWVGMMLRGDWLEDLNLEAPHTIDEWHTVLTAFKNEKNAEAPLMLSRTGIIKNNYFLSAYGVLEEFYNANGTVKYGPLEDGYRQYLELMNQWYSEGLVDPNFISNEVTYTVPADYMATGKAGAGSGSWAVTTDVYRQDGRATDPNFTLLSVPGPVLNAGDVCQARNPSYATVTPTSISAKCEYPEIAAQWLDLQYTQIGMESNSYGVEGETFTKEGGKYAYTDVIMEPTDNRTPQTAQFSYIMGDHVGLVSWERFNLTNSPEALASRDVWEADGMSLVMPEISLTDAEGLEFNTLFTDIQTFAQEKTAAFIMGNESFDNYDAFIESLKSMNVERCIELQQAALDRYNAR